LIWFPGYFFRGVLFLVFGVVPELLVDFPLGLAVLAVVFLLTDFLAFAIGFIGRVIIHGTVRPTIRSPALTSTTTPPRVAVRFLTGASSSRDIFAA
jgi:hypothetical protein